MRFRKPGPAPLSQRTRNILHEAQDRQSIKIMLDRGAIKTTIGATTHLRLDSGGYAAFPTVVVEEVERAARDARAARLGQEGEVSDVG